MNTQHFLRALDDAQITAFIQRAEAGTTGEIRVFITHQAVDDPALAAQRAFIRLGMARTHDRNGVLLFVAPGSQRFAVVGDDGIHARCGAAFWTEVAAGIEAAFRAGRFNEGVEAAITRVGEELRRHFPQRGGDTNELPDTVVRE